MLKNRKLLSLLLIVSCTSSVTTEVIFEDGPIKVTHEIITDELSVPWQMGFDKDGVIYISELKNGVRKIEEGVLQHEPWFDINPYIQEQGHTFPPLAGVQGFALDPDFSNNGIAYLGYAYESDDLPYELNRLIRIKANEDFSSASFDSMILDSMPGLQLHNAGQLKFGPDGKLYWSIADRFEPEVSQDLTTEAGSIIRLNPNGSIPVDNPFPDSYIYSYGHRNAQGFDWHPDFGYMVATEHGPSSDQGCCHDEINLVLPGNNYGWPEIRGDEQMEGMITPLIHSGVGEPIGDFTWAPSGGTFIKSGPWRGAFLFGGLRSQSLWKLNLNEEAQVDSLNRYLFNVYYRTRSVEQGPSGSIYLITSNKDRTNHPYGKDVLVKISVFRDPQE